jgi:penicillin amidase
MARIQADVYSLPAEALLPHVLAVEPRSEVETRALAALRDWDRRYETDRAGATIFQAFYARLLRRVVERKLGAKLAERYLAGEYERHGSMHMPLVLALMADPEHEWYRGGAEPTTRDEMVRRSFAEALDGLAAKYGTDPGQWQWGRAHAVTWKQSPLGRSGIGWLARIFNAGPFPARGDNYTVDGASFVWNDPFEVVHGTVLRMIVDLGDLSRSVGVVAPGQSEHVFHPHRDDGLGLLRKGEYHPLLFTRAAVEAAAEDVLRLEPGA